MLVACGENFTAVVMEKGDLWSFGKGASGQLGYLQRGLGVYVTYE